MCGQTGESAAGNDPTEDAWVVRIDGAGNRIWSGTYGQQDVEDDTYSLVETDFEEFLVGGSSGNLVAAWLINSNGDLIWHNTYASGTCYAVIELKSDDFLLAGGSSGEGYLLCINRDGDVLWEETYGGGDPSGVFKALREAPGGVVAGGDHGDQIWIVKTNFEGNVIWQRHHQPDEDLAYSCRSMVSDPEGGFVLGGCVVLQGDGDFYVLKVNDDGFFQWDQEYEWNLGEMRLQMAVACAIVRYDEGDFGLAGWLWGQGILAAAAAERLHSNGVERWRRRYDFEELENVVQPVLFYNAVLGHDNSVLCVGRAGNAEGGIEDGLLLKMEPERLHPQFISWSPEDTVFSVLVSDTVEFSVSARDAQQEELNYLWTMGGDTVSTDTITTVIFDEPGDFAVQCQVSDGEFLVEMGWTINVSEWYIEFFQPGSSEFSIRRGSRIDFTHQVRAIDDREFEYRWEHFGRGGNYEFDGEDSVRFEFDLMGDHIIRALVLNDEVTETVEWDVDVRSIIWWWWPHEFEISAYQDTTMVFEVFPFNEDSDSLEFSWFLDDEALQCDTSIVEISFPEVGAYEITAYTQEGVEADSIRWSVDVLERSFTTDLTDLADLPTLPVLYPASPNPFNSLVKLSMYLPKAAHVSLSIFDINGRQVSRLVDGNVSAGNQMFVWNAGGFPAGIYVVRMETGKKTVIQKVVLVR